MERYLGNDLQNNCSSSCSLYAMGAQPYHFEPPWLISNIFVAHLIFDNFTHSCRKFYRSVTIQIIQEMDSHYS